MDKAIALLKRHYYGNIILLVVVFLLMLFRLLPFFPAEQSVSIIMERYAIMITLIAIPVSLKFFAHRLKKISRPSEPVAATQKYKNASFLRLYTISAVTLLHILLFGISRNMNFFWFTVVLFIIFVFCKPSYGELESLTGTSGEHPLSEEEQKQQPHPNQPYGELREPEEERKQPEEGEDRSGRTEGRFEKTQASPVTIQNNYPENEQITGK